MSTSREAYRRAREADVAFVAAGVAYYWLVSLVPLFILAFTVLHITYGELFAEIVLAQLGSMLTTTGREGLRESLVDSSGSITVSLAGLVALVWSWTRMYSALEDAFERVYQGTNSADFTVRALAGLVVVPAISIGLVLTAGGVVTMGSTVVGEVLLIIGVSLCLFPVFVTLPPSRPGLRSAVAGAVTTAVAWAALSIGIGLYANVSAYSFPYGILGSVIFLILALYLGALALLFAVAVTAELDD